MAEANSMKPLQHWKTRLYMLDDKYWILMNYEPESGIGIYLPEVHFLKWSCLYYI